MYASVFKVYIVDIETDTFGNADSGSEKQRQECQITKPCTFMKGFLFFSQAFALLYSIQKKGYFIYIEADDFFIVQLWEPDESCRVCCKLFCSKKIIIKAFNIPYNKPPK